MTKDRMNLKSVRTLVVDSDRFSVTLLVQILHGLGLDDIKIAENGADAKKRVEDGKFQLCICDAQYPDLAGPDLIKWLRRLTAPTRFLPVLALIGYSEVNSVLAFRDAGVNMVMRKPASAKDIYDRIAWMSGPSRDFIEAESYVGPDRRFKFTGPPGGIPRRSTDLSTKLGIATAPNMSQEEIDSLVRPTRIFAE